jgi:hypothetical protein
MNQTRNCAKVQSPIFLRASIMRAGYGSRYMLPNFMFLLTLFLCSSCNVKKNIQIYSVVINTALFEGEKCNVYPIIGMLPNEHFPAFQLQAELKRNDYIQKLYVLKKEISKHVFTGVNTLKLKSNSNYSLEVCLKLNQFLLSKNILPRVVGFEF